jgi:aldehyde:ferredoxin oxidoreductase
MRYGEAGYYLEVDLATGNIERVESDPKTVENFFGGLGSCLKIFWDRTTPETKAFDPENLLIFSNGLLSGTPAFSTNRTFVVTLSPMSNLLCYPTAGGHFAPELKYAGYDKVIFSNKSPKWVYLWINNDKVELRDAAHLVGKGARDVQDLIKQELNEPKAQVAAIGPGAENRVLFASIEMDRGSASRQGAGAVMGDKKIKAIAVRGTKDVNLFDGPAFIKHLEEVRAYAKHRIYNPLSHRVVEPIHDALGAPQIMREKEEKWHMQSFSWGNARYRIKDFWTVEIGKAWEESQEKSIRRMISCFNCPSQCGALIMRKDEPPYMAKCFSKLSYLFGSGISDLEWSWKFIQRTFNYGLDSYSTPQVMAFAVELREAGILTKEDFAGTDTYPPCPPPEDKSGVFYWLLERIVRAEGIGKILGLGTKKAGEAIGKGAEAYAHNVIKGVEQMNIKLGMLDPLYFLMFATNEKLSITSVEGNWPQAAVPKYEDRVEWVEDWPQIPHERFKQYFLDWEPRGEKNSVPYYPTPPMAAEIVDWMEENHSNDDSLGFCSGVSGFCFKPPFHCHNYYKFVNAATGLDLDEFRHRRIVHRIRNLHRAFNLRRGMTRADDKPPEDHWKYRFPDLEEELLTTYYHFKGWNDEGVPARVRLGELDLGYVADELEERGILKKVPAPTAEELEAYKEERLHKWGY